ncbi:ATP-binding cassette domain-containing protein [Candidatus Fermentibacteria bacterium]|nr:ATP-binding cassette domain-containing protein [Candidatus Fermentibacteria bacterium]
MNLIEVDRLSKTFLTREKEPGFLGSLRSTLRPRNRETAAVRSISFAVEAGQRLAFIGPNGAGKSTTIKMLVGILYPTSGQASVLGKTPWSQRQALAREIGVVFGQKSQLWYHLPPHDSFDLLGRIFGLKPSETRARTRQLVELFEIARHMETPVRKLSLGERMRCEIAASLLHRPKAVFLDEPTIGLDVVIKQRIRDLILTLNRTEGLTLFLTSHDAGDMEALCSRALVINHGEIIFDGRVSALKRDYIKTKTISLKLRQTWEGFEMPGVSVLKHKGYGVKLEVSTDRAPIDRVIAAVLDRYTVADLSVDDPPMEEVISAIYAEPASAEGRSPRTPSPSTGEGRDGGE